MSNFTWNNQQGSALSLDQSPENLSEDSWEEEEEENDVLPARFSISVSRRDFDVDTIVKRLRNKDIFIPDFQRSYVWKPKQASRLVESLLLGLPVPGIFLSEEPSSNRLLVLDGQQRLTSILSFYEGKFPNSKSSFTLKGVHEKFERCSYKTLDESDRRQLDNSAISATIIHPHNDDEESIYYIFERLNTGGTLLKPQEIRSCIYHGELDQLLKRLNEISAWREVYGVSDKNRRDQELILRFLALYFDGDNYKPSMKEFLNRYMHENRNFKYHSREDSIKAFKWSIETLYRAIGKKLFRPNKIFVPTYFEGIMIGLAKRLEKGEINNLSGLRERYEQLINSQEFMSVSVKIRDLTSEQNVRARIQQATQAFADLH